MRYESLVAYEGSSQLSVQALSALAAVVTAVVTAVYVVLTFRLLGVTRSQARVVQTPHLTCELTREPDGQLAVYIENTSGWPAYRTQVDAIGSYSQEDAATLLDNHIKESHKGDAVKVIERAGAADTDSDYAIYDRFHRSFLRGLYAWRATLLLPLEPSMVWVLIHFDIGDGSGLRQLFIFGREESGKYTVLVQDGEGPTPGNLFEFPFTKAKRHYGVVGRLKLWCGKRVEPVRMKWTDSNLPPRIPKSLRAEGDLLDLLDGRVVVPGWLSSWSLESTEARGIVARVGE